MHNNSRIAEASITYLMLFLALFSVSCFRKDGAGGAPAGIKVVPTAGLVTTEARGTASFTVGLTSLPDADVTIALRSSDPAEGAVSPAVLVFSPVEWPANLTVTVSGVDETLTDGNRQYTIVTDPAVSADPNYNGIDAVDVSAVNVDDDIPGFKINPPGRPVTTEAGGTAVFTIALNTRPSADVTIWLSSSDPTEGEVIPASLTYTPDDWSIPQWVWVSGVDDAAADGTRAYMAVIAPAVSADAGYGVMDPADLLVFNVDDERWAVVNGDYTIEVKTDGTLWTWGATPKES